MNINDIVTELQTVANADLAIKSFIYGDISDVNTQRAKNYPLLLVDRNVTSRAVDLKGKKAIYTFRLFFYDLFQRTQDAQGIDQAYQQSLEKVINEYLQEIQARSRVNTNHVYRINNYEALSYAYSFYKANDMLQQINVNLEIYATLDCQTGVFNYD